MATEELPPRDPDMRRMWAVLLGVRDDGQACRKHLEGWTDPNGVYHDGMLTQHKQLKAEVEELKAAHKQGGERRWLFVSGGVGAFVTEAIRAGLQYLQAKSGGH